MTAERSDLVPGRMRCAKCSFALTRINLYVNHGTTGAGGNETEPCPNGCGPLWPVTWKQEAADTDKKLEHFFDRAIAAERLIGRFVIECERANALALRDIGVGLIDLCLLKEAHAMAAHQ